MLNRNNMNVKLINVLVTMMNNYNLTKFIFSFFERKILETQETMVMEKIKI